MRFQFRAARLRIGFALCAVVLALGCSSFRAARLYQSGTSALDRGDSIQAVADLSEKNTAEQGYYALLAETVTNSYTHARPYLKTWPYGLCHAL